MGVVGARLVHALRPGPIDGCGVAVKDLLVESRGYPVAEAYPPISQGRHRAGSAASVTELHAAGRIVGIAQTEKSAYSIAGRKSTTVRAHPDGTRALGGELLKARPAAAVGPRPGGDRPSAPTPRVSIRVPASYMALSGSAQLTAADRGRSVAAIGPVVRLPSAG